MVLRHLASGLLALMLVLAAADYAAAVEGEPAPPKLCNLDPRTIEQVTEISFREAPAEPDREQLSDPFKLPAGEEIEGKTRLELKKDLRRAIGCLNSGNLLLSLAAFTDEYVQRWLQQFGGVVTPDVANALTATETREEGDYITIIDYQEMVLLPDDSVLAVVYGDDPTDESDAGYTVFYLVEVERGRWLIDDFTTVNRVDPDDKSDLDETAEPTAIP